MQKQIIQKCAKKISDIVERKSKMSSQDKADLMYVLGLLDSLTTQMTETTPLGLQAQPAPTQSVIEPPKDMGVGATLHNPNKIDPRNQTSSWKG